MVRLFQRGSSHTSWLESVRNALRPHKTLLMIAAGLAVQWSAVHFAVSRPLTRELGRMESQLADSNDRLDRLVAARSAVNQTDDLLSALQAQHQSLGAAEASLASIRDLRISVEQEARQTSAAAAALQELSDLHTRLAHVGANANELVGDVESLQRLQRSIAALSEPTHNNLAQVEAVNRALSQINLLQARISEQSRSLPIALAAVEDLAQLQQAVESAGGDLDQVRQQADRLVEIACGLNTIDSDDAVAASEHAADLLALHDILADAESLRLAEAERNLRLLLDTQTELLHATPEIVAAAENLELLTDFEVELTRQLSSLTGLRQEMLEIALLRETVAQVAHAVQPLAELTDLRRLDGDQVRAMAREILERRTAQIDRFATGSSRSEVIGPASPFPPEGQDRPVPPPADH